MLFRACRPPHSITPPLHFSMSSQPFGSDWAGASLIGFPTISTTVRVGLCRLMSAYVGIIKIIIRPGQVKTHGFPDSRSSPRRKPSECPMFQPIPGYSSLYPGGGWDARPPKMTLNSKPLTLDFDHPRGENSPNLNSRIEPPNLLRCRHLLPLRSLRGRAPQCAKRTSLAGQLTRGGLGKPLGRGEVRVPVHGEVSNAENRLGMRYFSRVFPPFPAYSRLPQKNLYPARTHLVTRANQCGNRVSSPVEEGMGRLGRGVIESTLVCSKGAPLLNHGRLSSGRVTPSKKAGSLASKGSSVNLEL
jgi:hypothetical protein